MLLPHPARALLLDGAVGTELIARGLDLAKEPPEAFSLRCPDAVMAVHAAYAAAGAEVVQTNTFGALRPRLGRHGLAAAVGTLCRLGVELARQAAPAATIVGSLGPSGEPLPLASAAPDWLVDAYAEAAQALAAAGADALHLETQFHPAELAAALAGVRAGAPGLPLVASLALIPGATGLETVHGVPVAKMLAVLAAHPPDAVGVNCALEADRLRLAVRLLAARFDLPVWAKPQAKQSEKCAPGRRLETPEAFARQALALVAEGASAIGGCCGTGPAHIAALAALLARPAAEASP